MTKRSSLVQQLSSVSNEGYFVLTKRNFGDEEDFVLTKRNFGDEEDFVSTKTELRLFVYSLL